jgi:diguanylate cyclase (GGDEF)-like protein
MRTLGAPETTPAEASVARRLMSAYAVALCLIAILSGSVHLLLDRVIVENGDSASVINVAGRQRMLSQRIGLYSVLYSQNPTDETRAPLEDAIALMEASHKSLLFGNEALGLSGTMTPQSRALYTEAPWFLDERTRTFLTAARKVAASRDASALTTVLQGARADLLDGLDVAVKTFELEANARIASLRRGQQVVLSVLLLTLLAEALFILHPLARLGRSYASRLYQLATRDTLTGVVNRGHFFDVAQRLLSISYRKKQPLSVLLIDIDRFKAINDAGGHAAGDEVLRHFAQVVMATLRASDVLGRVGGEEFAVLLPDTAQPAAVIVAEKLRAALVDAHAPGLPTFTVSVGVASWGESDRDIATIIRRADEALHAAKASGRNQVMAAA